MWGRSVEKYGLRYMGMLSDGDSTAYKLVVELNPYPKDGVVKKLDCLNHAHKRIGTALRKQAKEGKLGGAGVGRLTAKKCDSLQNLFRGAIMSTLPDLDTMYKAIWATLWHPMSSDEEPRHHLRPKSPDSWCFYQKALARGEEPCSHNNPPCSTYLSPKVALALLPTYKRMSERSLLERLAHGGTQNTNECLNGMIWSRCPKTSFMGLKRVQGSVARTMAVFNEGANEMLTVMHRLNLGVSEATCILLSQRDQRRISVADAASEETACHRRKENNKHKKAIQREEDAANPQAYSLGAH